MQLCAKRVTFVSVLLPEFLPRAPPPRRLSASAACAALQDGLSAARRSDHDVFMDCPGRVLKGKIPSPSSLQFWAPVLAELLFVFLCFETVSSHRARGCVIMCWRMVLRCTATATTVTTMRA